MATKKRSHNASKRRKTTSTAKRRNVTYFSSGKAPKAAGRVANPKKRTHHRRRRSNPISTSTIAEGAKLGVSGMVIGFAQPMVRSVVGRFLPTGPVASAAVTLATAYGLGALSGVSRYTASWKRPLELAGISIVAAQLVSSYVLPWVTSFTAGIGSGSGATASGLGRTRRGGGMRDLVTLPAGAYDPYFGATPAIANAPVQAPAPQGGDKAKMLSDLLTMPAMPTYYR